MKSLRDSGSAETTIAGYIAHLRSAINWAVTQRLIPAAPAFPKLTRAKKSGRKTPMKGRPITGEEFDRLLPMAPEFARMLMEIPEGQRVGRVFQPSPEKRRGDRMTTDAVTRTISDIGQAAKVKVWTNPRNGNTKFATAHDLRRAFGERWSMRVEATVLMELMRHESINTTLRYYVGRNAERVADVVWSAVEAQSGGAPELDVGDNFQTATKQG